MSAPRLTSRESDVGTRLERSGSYQHTKTDNNKTDNNLEAK